MNTKAAAWNDSNVGTQEGASGANAFAVVLGRLLFGAIFLISAPGHFNPASIAMSAQQGVPFANVLVPLSGILAGASGLSAQLGAGPFSLDARRSRLATAAY